MNVTNATVRSGRLIAAGVMSFMTLGTSRIVQSANRVTNTIQVLAVETGDIVNNLWIEVCHLLKKNEKRQNRYAGN